MTKHVCEKRESSDPLHIEFWRRRIVFFKLLIIFTDILIFFKLRRISEVVFRRWFFLFIGK